MRYGEGMDWRKEGPAGQSRAAIYQKSVADVCLNCQRARCIAEYGCEAYKAALKAAKDPCYAHSGGWGGRRRPA